MAGFQVSTNGRIWVSTEDHGPGAIARNARLRYSTGGRSTGAVPLDVEIRDLACYEAACGLGGAE